MQHAKATVTVEQIRRKRFTERHPNIDMFEAKGCIQRAIPTPQTLPLLRPSVPPARFRDEAPFHVPT